MLRVDMELAGAGAQSMAAQQTVLMPNGDFATVHRLFDQHGFFRVGVRDRIALALITDQTIFGHLSPGDVTGVIIGLTQDRAECFLGPASPWWFAGRAMRTGVDFFGPKPGLPVEIIQRGELHTRPEVLFDKADGRFNLAFRLRPVRLAHARYEAVVSSEIEK